MLGQSLQQIQTLRQELAPQQLQSLEILMLPVAELEQKISAELMENPTLELVDVGTQALAGNPVEDGELASNQSDQAAEAAEQDEAIATLIQLDDSWNDYAPPRRTGGGNTAEDEERRRYMLNSLVDEPSLQEELLVQLRELDDLDEAHRLLYEEIIGDIDERGYLAASVGEIAGATGFDDSEVERALRRVQAFEPPGIGARDLRECLLLQLERRGEENSLAYRAASEYLAELGENHIPQVARKLGISNGELYSVLEDIRTLHPFPGTLLAGGTTNFVVPEITVFKDEKGQWQIQTNRDAIPRLRISQQYKELLKDPNSTAETKSYIREKIAGSKVLMRALGQRESTLEEIAKSLLVFQREFFEHGVHGMKPLVLSRVADDIDVHETTVSRAIAGKYLRTPHGVFSFKHFFSSGLATDSGEMVSSRSVKQRIQELVDKEDAHKPLSDQKLVDALKAEGFRVARRTVAKYREEVGIMPSNMRRSY